MKVGFISDIHLDMNVEMSNERGRDVTLEGFIEYVKQYITKQGLDYFFISGDVVNSTESIKVVEELNTTGVKVRYVLGNHDLWTAGVDTDKLYKEFLKDDNCLVNRRMSLTKDLEVVGMCSWHDGTYGVLDVTSTEYLDRLKNLGDKNNTSWFDDRYNIVERQLSEARKVMDEVRDKDIILLNHFVPFREFVVYKENNAQWNFGNSFMGSEKISEFVREYPNIKYMTFGHTHRRFGEVEKDEIKFISSPVGYVREWEDKTFEERFKECLMVKEF